MDKCLLQRYISDGLSSHKIAKLENCSATTIKYWLNKYDLSSNKKRTYTIEDVKLLIPNTRSIAELLIQLGLKPCGGNYYTIKKILSTENISTEHWNGQGWSKDQQLKDWSTYNSCRSLRKILIQERGSKCEQCNISHWLDIPLGVEMHHLDGDRTNNTKENLQLLCPNCHSITDNFKNRKRPK